MANTVPSPNMGMPVPVVSVDPGPDWAQNINSSLSIVDSHNHTTGQGVPITPSAININADLPMNTNNLITARSVRFSPQTAPLAGAGDLGCLFEQDVDLYYIDGSGNVIRLTQSGAPAGATGTITGLPSGTASASFAGTTFTFQSATNTPASLAVGPTTIAQAVPSGFGVTISANAGQASNYNVTLPTALPVNSSYLQSDPSGNLSFVSPASLGRAWLNTGAGSASTNLAIAVFSVIQESVGSDITVVANDNINGSSFTINTAGVYSISHSNVFNTAGPMGISLNSTELSTSIESIMAANRLAGTFTHANNNAGQVSYTTYLNPGDVIRPHCYPAFTNGSNFQEAIFQIQRVA